VRVGRIAGKTEVARSVRMRLLWQRVALSPLAVFAVVLFIYAAWTLATFHAGYVATDFALVSWHFAHQSTASSAITFGSNFRYSVGQGYDGQFCYFIALDPRNARFYIDDPAYRYGRILYPIAARLLAFGQAALIPYALILINLLAISGGVLLLAYWLRRHGVSPWLALVYGLYSGLFVAYQRDLTEPLGYGLVILAIFCFDFSRRRVLWAGICFGLAALAREATLVFAVVYLLARLFEAPLTDSQAGIASYLHRIGRNWRPAALMLALVVGPFLAYKLFLVAWLRTTGTPADLFPSLIPFSGLITMFPVRNDDIMAVVIVCVPGLICCAMSIWAIVRRRITVEVWALLVNDVLFVVMLKPVWYIDPSAATTRIATGVVLAALLSVPAFDILAKRHRRWLMVCAPLWVSYTCLYMATTAYPLLTRL
jgi:hypothetical protein